MPRGASGVGWSQTVDSTRDLRLGGTAENWSRRDGIRAGAVSGPWRSAPRYTPLEFEVGAAEATPPLVAEAAPGRAVTRAGNGAGWIVLGAFAALALGLGAYLLTPVPAPTTDAAPVAQADASGERPEAAPEPAAEADPPLSPAAPLAVAAGAVRLRVGPALGAERRAEIVAALAEAGYADIEVEPLPFPVASSRVGYFRATDRAAAEALSRQIGPALHEAAGHLGVRDYSALVADPDAGQARPLGRGLGRARRPRGPGGPSKAAPQ